MTKTCPQTRRVLWIGPSSDNFAWLLNRIAEREHTELIESIDLSVESLAVVFDQRVDRILLAAANRLDFPEKMLHACDSLAPEIPAAVVTGNWWNGSRRTGILPRQHLIQPWHRWWDVWSDWIDGVNPKLFGPDIGPSNHLLHHTDCEFFPQNQQILIVCDSLTNAITWQRQWECHVATKWIRSRELKNADSREPALVFYDLDDISNCDDILNSHDARLDNAHHLLVSSIPESEWIARFEQRNDFKSAASSPIQVLLASKPLGPRAIVRILSQLQSSKSKDAVESNVATKAGD